MALPFRLTRVLTDRGCCLTADAFEAACRRSGVAHRATRLNTPRTDSMVERFNGRVQREVLGITLYRPAVLDIVLAGFSLAVDRRRLLPSQTLACPISYRADRPPNLPPIPS